MACGQLSLLSCYCSHLYVYVLYVCMLCQIYVPPPDKEARTQILDINLKKMPLQIDVDISSLADKTHGFSGAEVVAICSEGALHALDENASAVSQDHLLRAISDIKPQITPTMIAFYENLVKSFK